MLERVQRQLTDIYRVDPGEDIRDYLITDRTLAGVLGQGALLPDTDESLLLSEEPDGIALSVFLDADMLARLDAGDPLNNLQPDQLDDLWKVVEGVSHFNYLVWCAANDRSVTLLELELQAEIDKYVCTLLLSFQQGDHAMGSKLHAWLFEHSRLKEELDDTQRLRYEAASRYASRFCHRIRERLLNGDPATMPELRHFYRLTQPDKISHIHARAWAHS